VRPSPIQSRVSTTRWKYASSAPRVAVARARKAEQEALAEAQDASARADLPNPSPMTASSESETRPETVSKRLVGGRSRLAIITDN